MSQDIEQRYARLRSTSLTNTERAAMRERLLELQQQQPVSPRRSIRQILQVALPRLSLMSKPMIIALLVAVSLALSGGVSLAAEQALPGDALYVVKTYINEPVRGALAVSSEAQAEWDARRVERRLEEAEQLAVDGRLSPELREAIEAQVKDRVEDVKEVVDLLRGKKEIDSAADISARLEIALRVHEQVLAKLADKHDGETDELHEKVKKHHEESEELEAEVKTEEESDDAAEHADDKQEAAEGKQKAAQHKVQEVRDFVAKARVSAETSAMAETKLKAVDALMVKGQAALEAKKYDEAFDLFRQAMRDAQDVKIIVATEQTISAEVRIDVQQRDDEEREDRHEDEDGDRKIEERDHEEDKSDEDEDDERDEDEHEDDEQLQLEVKVNRR